MNPHTSETPTFETDSSVGGGPENAEPVFLELDDSEAKREEAGGVKTGEVKTEAAAPAWFSRSRNKTPRQKAKDSKRIKIQTEDSDDEEKLTWRETVKRWVVGFDGLGYGTSLIVHLILLVLLSIIILEDDINESFSTVISDAEESEIGFEDLLDTKMEMAGAEAFEVPQINPADALPSEQQALPQDLHNRVATAAGNGANQNDGDGMGSGLKFAKPKAGKVVTKGSFTAWTVPHDPRPGQNYLIVIQIKLPKRMQRYPKRDLSGLVTGSDGYRQVIPSSPYGSLPVKDKVTQIIIPVPGAEELVKDTIEVRSKMLKEKQKLTIVF